MTKEIIILE